jgi:hypothetical protein
MNRLVFVSDKNTRDVNSSHLSFTHMCKPGFREWKINNPLGPSLINLFHLTRVVCNFATHPIQRLSWTQLSLQYLLRRRKYNDIVWLVETNFALHSLRLS